MGAETDRGGAYLQSVSRDCHRRRPYIAKGRPVSKPPRVGQVPRQALPRGRRDDKGGEKHGISGARGEGTREFSAPDELRFPEPDGLHRFASLTVNRSLRFLESGGLHRSPETGPDTGPPYSLREIFVPPCGIKARQPGHGITVQNGVRRRSSSSSAPSARTVRSSFGRRW